MKTVDFLKKYRPTIEEVEGKMKLTYGKKGTLSTQEMLNIVVNKPNAEFIHDTGATVKNIPYLEGITISGLMYIPTEGKWRELK